MKLKLANLIRLFSLCVLLMLFLGTYPCQADAFKITKIKSNSGYIETANVSCRDGTMYVEGWLKPHYWNGNRIYVRVDLKNTQGKVIATKTDYTYPTGRLQSISQFGVLYLVCLNVSQVKELAAIDVTYVN